MTPGSSESTDRLWGTVETFAHRGMAEVAGTALESAGVAHRLVTDTAGYHGDSGTAERHGVRLQVLADQVDSARALLEAGVQIRPQGAGDVGQRQRRPTVDSVPPPPWVQVLAWATLVAFVAILLIQFVTNGG